MLSIVYSSRSSDTFSDVHLVDLLLQSRRNNRRLGLSGMLVYRSGHFLQVLEGPEDVLRERMAIIASDPRHAGVRMLLEEHIDERLFPAWTMGYESVDTDGAARVPELRSTFEDLEAGRDLGRSVPALRDLIRWFQQNAA